MFPVGPSRQRNRGRGFAFNRGAKIPPSLLLPFAGATSLDSRITYTGSNGTYFNSSGVLTAATTNVARFDYNPSTLAARGLLIEEQRTNLALRSADFGTTWSLFNSTVLTDQVTAPDGTVAADKLREDNATAVHYTSQNVTITAGATYTVSVYAKQADDRYLQIGFDSGSSNGGYATFDLQAGTVTQSANKGTGSGISASIQAINNSWYRLIVTTVVDASSTSGRMFVVLSNSGTPGFAPSYLGTTGNGIYVWGAQIEAGAFATSYIATTSAAGTRSADVASITGANFSGFWNATQGTIVIVGEHYLGSAITAGFQADDGTNNNRITVGIQNVGATSGLNQITTGGILQAQLLISVLHTPQTSAAGWDATGASAAVDGVGSSSGSAITLPTVDRARLGASATATTNCWISSLAYYPTRLPDSTLRALSV